jgi:hypothetical protein
MNKDEAVKILKERGNMVRIEQVSELRKLVYPDMEKLNQILSDIYMRIDDLERKEREWKKQKVEEKMVSEANLFVRLRDQIYRLHLWQKLKSSEYREACRVVNPPFERIKDHKVRPMLKKFVRDQDYRDKLIASRTSVFANLSHDKDQDVKKKMILRRIAEIDKELEKEKDYKEACLVLIDWSKKSKDILFRKPGKSVY